MCRAKSGLAIVMAVLCVAMLGSAVAASPDARAAGDEAQSAGIIGNWLTQKRDGIIRISRTPEGVYEGRIVGGDDPARTDEHNPDPALRERRLIGQLILQDMQYDGRGHWSGGTIYDPDSGHTYRCRLELRGTDGLRVRGFLGVAVIGRSQLWTRYTGSSMQLPPPNPDPHRP